MKKLSFINLLLILILFSLKAQTPHTNKDYQEKIRQLVAELTLEEKASLCSGRDDWSTKPIDRLDIPWIWMSDGPHGLRRAPETNKAGYGDQLPATCFPTASAMAATWDLDLIYKVGQALGQECHAQNVNVLLGPGVNIKRSVLGGRNFEYYSEDPILSGEMGAAFINGVQSQGVGTSLKHYVANNVETMRMYMNSNVDDRTLHEIYLRPFEIAVKKAQPWTVMACYNRVQGTYGTQNPYILTDILKNQWKYQGIVISDWFAVVDRVQGIRSGMHIEMPGVGTVNDKLIVEAVKNGELDEKQLDKLVEEILFIVLRAADLEQKNVKLDVEGHHAFARQVVSESVTLLKNDRDILPVTAKKYKKIAVIGEFAIAPRYQGNGSSEVKPTKIDTALTIIKNEYGEEFEIVYAQGYKLNDDDDLTLIDEAATVASEADIALIFAGLPLHYESEGIDRLHINMPAAHTTLISEVSKVQENTVAILTNGSAVAMPWVDEVSGIVEAWLGGQAGAGGVADVLFGKVNPSGKLAETFPVKLEDTPSFFNFPGEQGEVTYGERIFVGYRYYNEKNITPLFPFGFGLSYTTFEYSNLVVSSKNISDTDKLTVTATISNTGSVTGKEVVQLYVSDMESSLQRPEKELKKFVKIELEPGQSQQVIFELDVRDFAYYDARRATWVAESGEFVIKVGTSSADIKLSESVMFSSAKSLPLAFDKFTFLREFWENEQTKPLIVELIPKWLKGQTPEGESIENAVIQDFMLDHPVVKLPYITNGEITADQVDKLVEMTREITYTP